MNQLNSEDIVLAEVIYRDGLNRKYLRPEDLRRLSHATFSSRRAIEGLYSGRHKTVQRGQSIEFRDYREYIPGDEINHLDWKVFARTDKLFIKLFEHQTDLSVHLIVDASKSMSFSGFENDGDTKYDSCCRLAAAIGFLVSKQHDRFSFATAQSGLEHFLRPGGTMKHLFQVLDEMERVKLGAKAELATAIESIMQHSRKRDLLCVFSDLLDEELDEEHSPLLKQLRIWMERGGEVIVFHVLHDDEIDLPAAGAATFVDSESYEQLRVDVDSIKQTYQQKIQHFLATWAKRTSRIGVDYNLVRVSDPYSRVLEKYFARRGDRLGTRTRNLSKGTGGESVEVVATPDIVFIAD